MKKTLLTALFSITAVLLFVQSAPLEARPHRPHAHIQVGVRGHCAPANPTVVRRYVAPVYPAPVVYYTPGYMNPGYAVQGYMTPGYGYATPAPSSMYVEEIYVAPPRSISFGGLSFSWNFFK